MVGESRRRARTTFARVFSAPVPSDVASDPERSRLVAAVIRAAASVSMVLCVIWLAIALSLRWWTVVAVEFIGLASCAGLLWLVARGRLVAASHATMATLLALILWITLLEGNVEGRPPVLHLYAACLAMVGYFIFAGAPRRVPAGYAALCLLLFVSRELEWLAVPSPFAIDADASELTRHVTFLAVFVISLAMAKLFVRDVTAAERRLADVNRRLEVILETMLPRSVARRLRRGGRTFADAFPGVTILFADLVDFDARTQGLTAREIVALLDDVFTRFDELAEKWGVEKIKTMGTGYMAVAGIPEARPDHAQAVARLALAMRDASAALGLPIRIGINSGPVVAGVIGRKRFIYDLWGDAVNVASRMESHGLAGAIQVTDATKQALGEAFRFDARGALELKGRGAVPAWLLLGENGGAVHPAAERS
jgi:guanylate cyclase